MSLLRSLKFVVLPKPWVETHGYKDIAPNGANALRISDKIWERAVPSHTVKGDRLRRDDDRPALVVWQAASGSSGSAITLNV